MAPALRGRAARQSRVDRARGDLGREHPYGTSTIGRADELDKATLAEARAFARAYYRPNNATLVVAGVFDVPATKEMVTRYFATIPPGQVFTTSRSRANDATSTAAIGYAMRSDSSQMARGSALGGTYS